MAEVEVGAPGITAVLPVTQVMSGLNGRMQFENEFTSLINEEATIQYMCNCQKRSRDFT
jgi:hypothetical protein